MLVKSLDRSPSVVEGEIVIDSAAARNRCFGCFGCVLRKENDD